MPHSIFGWDYPPGVSQSDIDRAFGEDDEMPRRLNQGEVGMTDADVEEAGLTPDEMEKAGYTYNKQRGRWMPSAELYDNDPDSRVSPYDAHKFDYLKNEGLVSEDDTGILNQEE